MNNGALKFHKVLKDSAHCAIDCVFNSDLVIEFTTSVKEDRFIAKLCRDYSKPLVVVDANNITVDQSRFYRIATEIIKQTNLVPGKLTIFVTGAELFYMRKKFTQRMIDSFMTALLDTVKVVVNKHLEIINIGKPGFEEAAIKAAYSLNIPSTVFVADWKFMDVNGITVYGVEAFKARFPDMDNQLKLSF